MVLLRNNTYKSIYYLLTLQLEKFDLFIFAELFRFVGEQSAFKVFVFATGPDVDPGRFTFPSILAL